MERGHSLFVATLTFRLTPLCRYAWLGFTDVQLKANQFVLFREDGEWTVKRLVSLLGDLTAVYEKYGYAGYVARMGLSFASTSVALKVVLLLFFTVRDTELTMRRFRRIK